MKRTYNFRCMLIVIAAIVLHAVPWAFDTVVHSQTRTTLGVGRLHEAFAQASGRFIEYAGQFPHDIRFVAPYEGGWILFFDDRVE